MKKAYECRGKLLKDGHIDIPEEIKEQLKNNKNLKLIILAEEQDENTDTEQKIKALENINNILSEEEKKDFDPEKFKGITNLEEKKLKKELDDMREEWERL